MSSKRTTSGRQRSWPFCRRGRPMNERFCAPKTKAWVEGSTRIFTRCKRLSTISSNELCWTGVARAGARREWPSGYAAAEKRKEFRERGSPSPRHLSALPRSGHTRLVSPCRLRAKQYLHYRTIQKHRAKVDEYGDTIVPVTELSTNNAERLRAFERQGHEP